MKRLNRKAQALLLACALLPAAGPRASAGPAPQLSAPASFAGAYQYKTSGPDGDRYDNTLEVEDRGGGRLHVTLSGTYVYKADGGAETMHEGGGKGEALLRGNVATAKVTPDGADAPCRVLIIFEGGEAGVKADSSCGFNVRLDGSYRGAKAGAARPAVSFDAAGMRHVRFDRLGEFVEEHRLYKTGSRFVITSVPAEKIKVITPEGEGRSRRGMFNLSMEEDAGGAPMSFVTSAQLVKNLRASAGAGAGAATLRVTATLVQFEGCCDVYRSSFVTKVEAYGEDGMLLWVATGPEPVKVRMPQ